MNETFHALDEVGWLGDGDVKHEVGDAHVHILLDALDDVVGSAD